MPERRRQAAKENQWVRDKYPVSASWSEIRLERLIRDARDDTEVVRFVLLVAGSAGVAWLGFIAPTELAEFGLSRTEVSATLIALMTLAGVAIGGLRNLVWQRKLASLVEGEQFLSK